jgi:hypothetical protein
MQDPEEAYLVRVDAKNFVKSMYAASCDFQNHVG